jgi:acylphosphatase
MSDDEITSLRLKIEGFVQAVGFRHFAITEARRLGLDGSVANSFDGTVEVMVSGPNAAVETFVGLCMRGPTGSRVTNIEIHKAEPPKEKGFRRLTSF